MQDLFYRLSEEFVVQEKLSMEICILSYSGAEKISYWYTRLENELNEMKQTTNKVEENAMDKAMTKIMKNFTECSKITCMRLLENLKDQDFSQIDRYSIEWLEHKDKEVVSLVLDFIIARKNTLAVCKLRYIENEPENRQIANKIKTTIDRLEIVECCRQTKEVIQKMKQTTKQQTPQAKPNIAR